MTQHLRICLAGEGAIARKHLDALARLDSVEVVSLVGGVAADAERLAGERGIGSWTLDFHSAVTAADVDAVIVTTPISQDEHVAATRGRTASRMLHS